MIVLIIVGVAALLIGGIIMWLVTKTLLKSHADNIIKVVADSLNSVAYRDDAQIVDCQIRKYYSHQPRIEVTILTADERR